MPGWSGCDVCLSGFEEARGDFTTSHSQCRGLRLPEHFTPEHIKRAQKDCEILGEKLRTHPAEVTAILDSILANKFDHARRMAHEIGISEESFVEQGGGLLWLVVVAVLLYATDAY
jgi:hypothetical protein